jgi:putative membrane protein
MALQAREHVPELTGLLSVVALALVFAAVGGVIPADVLPHHDGLVAAIPHLNAVISLTAIGTIIFGVRSIRDGKVDRHRQAMLTSTLLFASFLVLYLYRLTVEGTTVFDGPTMVRQFVYLPMLAIHILFAIVCIPVVFYALLLAGTHSVAELPETNHPRAGRLAATLWVISFALGFVVYLFLYVLF